jgi:hypothetical protein
MLPKDAFLRRLPTALSSTQVVLLEALVFSHDSVETAFEAIEQTALHSREKIVEEDYKIHVELFNRAWRIVDCLHTVRQVLNALDYKTPAAEAFHGKYDCARQMRNKMDHLKGNAKNFGAANQRPPIFGALSYICIPESDVIVIEGQRKPTGGGIVMLTSGRVNRSGGQVDFVMPDLSQLYMPVGFFRFEAFDYAIKLDEAVRDLRNLTLEINTRTEEQLKKIASEISRDRSLPIEQVMANPAGALAVFIAFSLNPPRGGREGQS